MRTIFTDLATVGHDEDFSPIAASERTSARPGSLEKIEIMRERVARGEDLFHPDDARIPLPPRDSSTGFQPGIREMAAPRC